jgi:hypothetical protein
MVMDGKRKPLKTINNHSINESSGKPEIIRGHEPVSAGCIPIYSHHFLKSHCISENPARKLSFRQLKGGELRVPAIHFPPENNFVKVSHAFYQKIYVRTCIHVRNVMNKLIRISRKPHSCKSVGMEEYNDFS